VGEALKGVRSQVFLATKASPRNFRRADLLAAVDRSLKRLQTDYIDLYQLHWPNYTIPVEETMEAMQYLADVGKIRFIGVSRFYSMHYFRKTQSALTKRKVAAHQVVYSLVERTIEMDLLPYCQGHEISVIAFSPLGRDFRIIRNNDPMDELGRVAAEAGKTRAQVALNWCISKGSVIAIPKSDSVKHVVENCGASGWRLSLEQVRRLDQALKCQRRRRIVSAVGRVARHVLQMTGRSLD
jgi:diketogulonate reductase-like aldo/keto reductase